MRKWTLEKVRKCFKRAKCVLLATEYIDSKTKMPYICSCGNKSGINLSNFRRGQRCMKCGIVKREIKKIKYNYEFVKQAFEQAGCVLLETKAEYANSNVKLRYICKCGNKSKILLSYFLKGRRCTKCGPRRRWTLEEIRKYFKQQGCTLLAKVYEKGHIRMPYICLCGNQSSISWENFRKGRRCNQCGIKKRSDKRRLSYEFIRDSFAKRGFTLLATEYVSNSTKMPYICSCGNRSETTWADVKAGNKGCRKCWGKSIGQALRYSYEFIKSEFAKAGCTLLATEYINARTKMPYICSCGKETKITYDSFRSGVRCRRCGRNEIPTLEFIKEFFEKRGCRLLSKEYINNSAKLSYVCRCGNESAISWADFRTGVLCGCESRNIKRTLEFVRQSFSEGGCTLLATEYINAHTKMPFICSCGNHSAKTWNDFDQGNHGCYKCIGIRSSRAKAKIKQMWEQVDDPTKKLQEWREQLAT